MRRSFWIIGSAALAVVVAGSGVTWWLVSSSQSPKDFSAVDPSTLVYTGEDLAGFLIDQDSAREATNSEIKLSLIGHEFSPLTETTFEPTVCSHLFEAPTTFPSGYRGISNHIPWNDEVQSFGFDEAVYQLPTIPDGADAFSKAQKAMSECNQYTESFENGQGKTRTNTVTLTATSLDFGTAEVVAGLLTYTGNSSDHVGVITMRFNNVIVSLRMVAKDISGVSDGILRKLAGAMKLRAETAEKIKIVGMESDGRATTGAAATPWLIDFGSIGPINYSMSAQTAVDTLGLLGADIRGSRETWDPPNGYCATYFLGSYRGVGLSSLADSDGAAGRLDAISNFAGSGTAPIDPDNLAKNRPRTAAGIKTGSTMAELKAAYPDQLEISPHRYVDGAHYVYLYGPNKTVINFVVGADDVVYGITTGRVPEAQYVEGCA